MVKPYALLSFDPLEWDPKALSYELDVIDGVDNWVLIFGNAFFIEKTVSASAIIEAVSEHRNGRSFVIVEFEAADANGMLPRPVAEEIRESLSKQLTAA